MVTMTNLHVEGEDFFFVGDLRLLGKTKIEDGNFTVTGDLILAQSEDDNGEIIAPTFEIINGDFTVGNLWTEDINGDAFDPDDGDLICNDILNSFSIYVNGHICCTDINSIFDIFCVSADVAETICSGDLYADDYYYCNNNDLSVKGSLVIEDLRNSGYVEVG